MKKPQLSPNKMPSFEDEYSVTLEEEGVEDETLLEPPADVKFEITSYGADYTVDNLITRLKTEAFYVPSFQRQFIWSQKHASRFVESLLMGLPVPGIFLYKEAGSNRNLIIDGQQRLRTLQKFYEGSFAEKKFRLIGVQSTWAEKTYSELAPADKLKLDDSVIHATIFQQAEPKDRQKSVYFVFERINSGGMRLSPQEIRNCINDGSLLASLRKLNEDKNWRNIFGAKKNTRLKDQELILRFFAIYERLSSYERPMRDFLNKFTADYARISAQEN